MPNNRDDERYLKTDIEDESLLDTTKPVLPSTNITKVKEGDTDVFGNVYTPIHPSISTQLENQRSITNIVSSPVLPESRPDLYKPYDQTQQVEEEEPSAIAEIAKTLPRGVLQLVLLGKKTLSGALSLPLAAADAAGYDIPIIKALRDKYRDDATGLEFALNAEKLGIAPDLFVDNSLRDAFFKSIQRKEIDTSKYPVTAGAQFLGELGEQAFPLISAIAHPAAPVALFAGSTFEDFQKRLVEKGESEAKATAKALAPSTIEAGIMSSFGKLGKLLKGVLPYARKALDPAKAKLADLLFEGAKKEALAKLGFETLFFQTIEAEKAGFESAYGISQDNKKPLEAAFDAMVNIDLLLQSGAFDLFLSGAELAGAAIKGRKLRKLIENNIPKNLNLPKTQVDALVKTVENFYNLSPEEKQKVALYLMKSENKKARYAGTYLWSKTADLDHTLGEDIASRLRYKMVEDILSDKPIDFNKTVAEYLRDDINFQTNNKIGIDPKGNVAADLTKQDLLEKELQDTIAQAKNVGSEEVAGGVIPPVDTLRQPDVGVEERRSAIPEEIRILKDKFETTKQTLLEGNKPKAIGFFEDRDVIKILANAKDKDAFEFVKSRIQFEDDGNGIVPIVEKKIVPVRLNKGEGSSIIVESMFDPTMSMKFDTLKDAMDFVISDIIGVKPKESKPKGVIPEKVEPVPPKEESRILVDIDKKDPLRIYDTLEVQDESGNVIKGTLKRITRGKDGTISSIYIEDQNNNLKNIDAAKGILLNRIKAYDKENLKVGNEYVFTIKDRDTNYKYKKIGGILLEKKDNFIKIKTKEGDIKIITDNTIYKVSDLEKKVPPKGKIKKAEEVDTETSSSTEEGKKKSKTVTKTTLIKGKKVPPKGKKGDVEKIGEELKELLGEEKKGSGKKPKSKSEDKEEVKKKGTKSKDVETKESISDEGGEGTSRLSKLKGLKKVNKDNEGKNRDKGDEPKLSVNIEKDTRAKAKVFSVVKDVVDNFFSGKKLVSVQAIKDYTVKTLERENRALAETVKNRFTELFGKYFKNGKISEDFHRDFEEFKAKNEEYFLEEAEIEREPIDIAEVIEEPKPKQEKPITYRHLIPFLKEHISSSNLEEVAKKLFEKGYTVEDLLDKGVANSLKEAGIKDVYVQEKFPFKNKYERVRFINDLNLTKHFYVKEVKVEGKKIPVVFSEVARLLDGEGYSNVISSFLTFEYGRDNYLEIDKRELKLEAIKELFDNYLVEEIIDKGKSYKYTEYEKLAEAFSKEKGIVALKLSPYFLEGAADILQRKSDLIANTKDSLIQKYKEAKARAIERAISRGVSVEYKNKKNQKQIPKEWYVLERSELSDEENELFRYAADSKTSKFKAKDFVVGFYNNPSASAKGDLPDYIIMTRDNNPRFADIYEKIREVESLPEGGFEIKEYYSKVYFKFLSYKYREILDDLKFFLETGKERTIEVEKTSFGIRPDFIANEDGVFSIDYNAFRTAIDLTSRRYTKFIPRNVNPQSYNFRTLERIWGDYIKDIPSKVERVIEKVHGLTKEIGNLFSIYSTDSSGNRVLVRPDVDLLWSNDPHYISERRKVSLINEYKIEGYLMDKFVKDINNQEIISKRIELRGKYPKGVDFKDYLKGDYLSKLSTYEFDEVLLANNIRYTNKLIDNNMNSIRSTIVKNNLVEILEKDFKKYFLKEKLDEEAMVRFGKTVDEFIEDKELFNKHKSWFSRIAKEQNKLVREMMEGMSLNDLIESTFDFYTEIFYEDPLIGKIEFKPDLLGFRERILKKDAHLLATNKLEKLFIGIGIDEPLSKKYFESIDMEEFQEAIRKEAIRRYEVAVESNFKQEFNLEKLKNKRPVAIRVEEYGFEYSEGSTKIRFPVLDMYKIVSQDNKTGRVILQSSTGGLLVGKDGKGFSYLDLKENGFIITSMDHVESGKFGSVFLSISDNVDANGEKILPEKKLTEKQMEEVVRLLSRANGVVLYNTEDDLPNYIKEALKMKINSMYQKEDLSMVEGFTFPNGSIGLILSNISQERLGKVLKHELFHRGVNNLLTTNSKKAINLFVSALMKKFNIFNADELNEFLAIKAEEVYKTTPFQNIKTTLKNIFAKYKNIDLKLTDEDVAVFLNKYIEEGTKYRDIKSYIRSLVDSENNLDSETKAFLSTNIGNPIRKRIEAISDLDEKLAHFLSVYVEKFGLHKELKNDEKAGDLTNISRDLIDRFSKLTNEEYLSSYLPLALTPQEMKQMYDGLLKNNLEFEANVFYQNTRGLTTGERIFYETKEKFDNILSAIVRVTNFQSGHPFTIMFLNDLVKYTYTYDYDTKTYKREKRTPTTMEGLPTISDKVLKIVFETYDPKETNLNLMEYYLETEVKYNTERHKTLTDQLSSNRSKYFNYENYKKENFDIYILSNDLPEPKEGQDIDRYLDGINEQEKELIKKVYNVHTDFISLTGTTSRLWCFSDETTAKSFYRSNSIFAFVYNDVNKLPEIAINLREKMFEKGKFEIEVRGIASNQEVQTTHYNIAKELTLDVLSRRGLSLDEVNIVTDADFKKFLSDKEQKVVSSSTLFYKPDSEDLYPALKKIPKTKVYVSNKIVFNVSNKELFVEDIKKFVTNIVSNISKEKDPTTNFKIITEQIVDAVENRFFEKYKNEITEKDIEEILTIPTLFPNKSILSKSEYNNIIAKIFSSILTEIIPKGKWYSNYDQSLPMAIEYLDSKGLLTNKSKEILRDFFSYDIVEKLLTMNSVFCNSQESKLFCNFKKVQAYKYFLDLDKQIPEGYAYRVAKLKYSPETAIVAKSKDEVFLISKIDYSKNVDDEVDKLFGNIVKSISKDDNIPNYKNIPINIVYLGIGDSSTSNKLIYRAHIKLIDKLMDIFNVDLKYFPFNTYIFDKYKHSTDILLNNEVFNFVFEGIKHKEKILSSKLFEDYYSKMVVNQVGNLKGESGSDYSLTLNMVPEEFRFTQNSKNATLIFEDNIYKYFKDTMPRSIQSGLYLTVYSPQYEKKSKINIINNIDRMLFLIVSDFNYDEDIHTNTTYSNINITFNKNIQDNKLLSIELPNHLGLSYPFYDKLKKEYTNIFGDTLNITINFNDLTFDKKRYIIFFENDPLNYNLKVTINSKNKIENFLFLKGGFEPSTEDNIDMQKFLTLKSDHKLVYEIPAKIQLSTKGKRVDREFATTFEENGLSKPLDDILTNFELVTPKPFLKRAKENFFKMMKSFKAYPYLKKTKDDLVLGEIIRRLREVPNGAYNYLEMIMKDYYTDNSGKKLTEDQIIKASVYITASDLLNSINAGVYTTKLGDIEIQKKLPFGFNSRQEVERFVEIARGKLDQSTIEFIQKRNKLLSDIYNEMVAHGIYNKSFLEGSPDYLRRIVITTTGMFNDIISLGMGETLKYKKYGFLKERTGSSLPYITDIRVADTSYLLQSRALIEYYKLIDELKVRFNKTPDVKKLIEDKLKAGEFVETNPVSYVLSNKITDEVGDTLTVFDLKKFRAISFNDYNTDSFKDFMNLAFERYATDLGIDKATFEKIESLLFDAEDYIIVPNRYKKTFETISDIKKESQVGIIIRKLTNAFRNAHTYLPLKVIKWQFNNAFGDLETAIRYPKLLKEVPKAFSDLWDRYFSDKRLPKELEEELDKLGFAGTIGSGFFSRELANVGLFKFNRLFNGNFGKDLDSLFEVAKKYGLDAADVYKNFMIFRESVLRLASYRFFKKLLTENPNVKVYGASESKLIDALRAEGAQGIDKAAEILSRQLIGDYGHLSEAGQYLRSHLIPFYSFMEVNFRRQLRSLINIFKENYSINSKLAAPIVGLMKMFMVYGAILLWNKLNYPEENEKLKKMNTNSMYLISNRDAKGNLTLIPVQSVIRDFLEWFNLDNPNVLEETLDLIKDSKYIEATAKFVNRPASKVFSGMGIIKIPYELWAGKTIFPDIERGVPIRDVSQYIASQLGIEPVYVLHQAYTKKQPFNAKKFAGSLFPYRYVDKGESDYNYSMALVSDFLKSKGIEQPEIEPVEKTNALYFYKKALKEDDKEVAEYWKQKYLELGGNLRGIRISLTKSDPIRVIPIKYRHEFFRSLGPEDRSRLINARRWWYREIRM